MKNRNLFIVLAFALILAVVPLSSLLTKDQALSETERRPLAQWMSYRAYREKEKNADLASYLAYLEEYLLDQFPQRDPLRSLNALMRVYGLRQGDHKGYYKVGGHLGKLDPLLREKAVNRALSIFNRSVEGRFSGSGKTLFALIPDKNVWMAEAGYPHYSYDTLLTLIGEGMEGVDEVVSLLDQLSLDDYYRGDPHWDQSKIVPVAERLLTALGMKGGLAEQDLGSESFFPYRGTYAGQAGLGVEADRLSWLTGDFLDEIRLLDLLTGQTSGLYQTDKLAGPDPYDLFMGGARPLLKLDNPARPEGKQLVVFRDSFGSSLIPLLAGAYREVLVIDLRYITMEAAADRVTLDPDADVLHLYSTSVLNSPGAFLG